MDVTVDSRCETEKKTPVGGAVKAESPSISLVIPAYNEQDVIGQAIREADDALARVTDDYEIIVVDDGSHDATRQRAEAEAGERCRVRVVAQAANRGYGAALRSGFQSATKSCVAFTDADCQFDLRELNRLTLLIDGYDIVCGYRIDRQDHWLRGVYSKTYNAIVRVLLGTRVRDCDCALKLFRRETLETLPITTDGFLVNAELLSRASLQGNTVVEVGVSHRPRSGGESKVSPLHVFPVLLALIRFWWATVMFPAASRASGTGSPVSVEGDSWTAGKTLWPTLGLGLLAGLMLFGNLSYPFFEPDESRYAQIALEMVETGDYLVPRLQGEPYLDKPPLLYWVTAASFHALGRSEFAARFPSAIAAMLTVIVTSLLGGRLLGARSAYLASLMLFLCLGFVLAGRFLIMDGLLTLFTTIGLLASFLAIADRHAVSPWWWLTAAVATGLGMMTKGPVALLLILPPLVAYHWLQRMSVLRARHWLAFALIVVTITCPWFILIARQRDEFAAHFLWEHHVLRFFTAYNHVQPFWYYLPVLLIGMFPSSLLAGPVLGFLAGRSGELRDQRTRELGAVALAGVWIVVFFSLSRCKLPTYVLPAVPFLCLVQGRMVAGWMHHSFHFPTWGSWVARIPLEATTAALIAGSVIAVTDWRLEADGVMDVIPNLVVIAATTGFLAYRLIRRRAWPAHMASWGVAAATCLLMIAFAFQSFVPELAEYRSINANAARLQYTIGGSQLPVVFLDWRTDGSSFYLRPDLVRRWSVEDMPSIQQFVIEHPQFLVVANPPAAEALHAELEHRVTIDRSRGARGRLFLFSAIAGSNGPSATRLSSPMRPNKLR